MNTLLINNWNGYCFIKTRTDNDSGPGKINLDYSHEEFSATSKEK